MTSRTSLAFVIAVWTFLTFAPSVSAAPIVFDFEDAAATYDPLIDAAREGELTSLTLTDSSGLTLTITRPDSSFDTVLNTGTQAGKPPNFGSISLDPFFDATSNTAFIGNFSSPIDDVNLVFGDYRQAAVETDFLLLQAFSGLNATGTLLGQTSTVFRGVFFQFEFGFAGIAHLNGAQSIRFIAGSAAFPNSVFYDNITVVPSSVASVPEPTSLLLLGMAAIVKLWSRKQVGAS
jgi:hypothetical protein